MSLLGNKLLIEILGKPVLAYTLQAFMECGLVERIVLVVPGEEIRAFQDLVNDYSFSKVSEVVAGGERRQESVYKGLKCVDADIVVIHDAARPFVTGDLISNSVREAMVYGAAVVAVPLGDTVKVVNHQRMIEDTLNRTKLWAAQTPQTFKFPLILKAYERAIQDGFVGTDDASLVERLGHPVRIVMGSVENIKITLPEDLVIAEAIARYRLGSNACRDRL